MTIAQKAGENDQLFGSVTAQDIAAALEKRATPSIAARCIWRSRSRPLGDFKVTVKLHREVTVELPVHVVKEEVVSADPGLGPSPYELLEAAARGRIGVDRRFLHSILDAATPKKSPPRSCASRGRRKTSSRSISIRC